MLTATTDVHRHGKQLVDSLLWLLAVEVCDGGISVDPNALAKLALRHGCDAIAFNFGQSLLKTLASRTVF